MTRILSILASVSCASLLLTNVGCNSGPPVGEVSGTVTMDGEPLDNAMVSFVPVEGGQTAIGKTDASGKYTLYRLGEPGAVVGSYTVKITSIKDSGSAPTDVETGSDAYMEQAMGGSEGDYDNATTSEPIPSKYNTGSTLQADVEEGTNTFDFELTSS